MKEVRKKIYPQFFDDVKKGKKKFELRKDEDNIEIGDKLILEEYVYTGDIYTSFYTGRVIAKKVRYVLRNASYFGLMPGYCIIGF